MTALGRLMPRHSIHKEVDMIAQRYSPPVRLRALAALLGALVALLLAAGAVPAQASPIFCGAVLGPGTYFLEADLGPCPVGFPAVTLNSAVLNLNEFTIRCSPSAGSTVGVYVQGSDSWVGNGIVSGCTFGVVLAGAGWHTVMGIIASGNGNGDGFDILPKSKHNSLIANVAMSNVDGFEIWGSDNCLTGNASMANTNNGFVIRSSGARNRLSNNGAVNNGANGFDVEGNSNVVAGNRASENGDDGFDVAGQKNVLAGNIADTNFGGGLEAEGPSNQFYGNSAGGNGAAGFEIYKGKNTLTGNTAEGNAAGGFLVVGNQNTLIANKSSENEGFGFQVVGDKNSVDGSLAMVNGGNGFEGYGDKNGFTDGMVGGNGGNGIVLAFGATKNYVGQNSVFGDGEYDLKDENPVCSNEWFNNVFESSFQICD
jgi:parallel beta-helix repeat protein